MKRDNLIDQYPAGYNIKHIANPLNIIWSIPSPNNI